ncbi:MAG: hypothetical protein ACREQW_13675 [Candidatus Binatia bacterium]
MLKILLVFLFILGVLLFIPAFRAWFLEELKELSDRLLLLFLSWTSGFERELTGDGRTEQKLWREQRLRNLRGLTLRSRQKFAKSSPDDFKRS